MEARVLFSTISGFGNFSGFSVNQSDSGAAPTISAGSIVMTNQSFDENRSIFYNTPENITAFSASFTYQASNVSAFNTSVGGTAFVVQDSSSGASAVGSEPFGALLGDGGITPSAAITLELGNNPTTSGYYTGGGRPGGSPPTSPVNLASGDPINVTITYNGSLLQEKLVDTVTAASYGTSFIANLSSVLGGATAYVGITAGNGFQEQATQEISNFQFTSTGAVQKSGTVTTLLASPTSATVGSGVQLTARVSPAQSSGTTPTGSVTFSVGTTVLGTATLSNGTAIFSTTGLPIGSDAISAAYAGDTTFTSSTSAPATVHVGPRPLTASLTTLHSSALILAPGASVTLTATVAPANGSGATPTGTVDFMDGNVSIGSATVRPDGTATLTTSALPTGTDSITAAYGGDSTYAASTSSAVGEQVGQTTPSGSATILSSSPLSAVVGDSITFTATVTPVSAGSTTPGGSVTFYDGNGILGIDPVGSNGIATFSTMSLTAGGHLITASYGGGAGYAASVSRTLDVQVIGVSSTHGSSTTTLTASAPSIVANDTVTFTATVSPSEAGGTPPTGTVDFVDNGTTIGSATVQSDGAAAISTRSLPAGNQSVTATYRGNGNYSPSSSAAVAVTVATPPSTVAPNLGKIVLPVSAIAGGTFLGRFPVSISNSGMKLVGRFTVEVFISTNDTLDAGAILLSSVQKNLDLADGGSKSIIATVKKLPATVPDGNYYLLARVTDPSGATNLSASAKTVRIAAPFVSLVASVGGITPKAVAIGKPGSILVTLTNNGNEVGSGLLHLSLDPSADGETLLAGETLATYAKHVSLSPGKSHTYRLRFKIPTAATGGTYYPFLTASLAGVSTTAIGAASFTIG